MCTLASTSIGKLSTKNIWNYKHVVVWLLITISIYHDAHIQRKQKKLQGHYTLLTLTCVYITQRNLYTKWPWIPSAWITTCIPIPSEGRKFHVTTMWMTRVVIVHNIACMQDTIMCLYITRGFELWTGHHKYNTNFHKASLSQHIVLGKAK